MAGVVILTSGAVAQNAPTTMPATRPAVKLEPADIASPKTDRNRDRFLQKHREFLARGAQGKIGVLFLGDSITEGWNTRGKAVWDKYYAAMDAANFGISGDKTQHVLWRIDHGELDGISPKVVVLMIGTNNIAYPAEDILRADQKIVREIHQKLPDTKLLLLGIFPRGRDPQEPAVAAMREKIKTVNEGLAKLDDGDKTRYLDLSDKFLAPDGTIPGDVMPDAPALHPDEKGYQIWAETMQPLLEQMMK